MSVLVIFLGMTSQSLTEKSSRLSVHSVGINNKGGDCMCGFFDDFDDDCDDIENEDIMDEDSFEDSLEENLEMDEPFAGDPEFDDEPVQTESEDNEFTAKNAIFSGAFAGWAYEEGLEKGHRKKIKRKMFRKK